jgi:histidine triad (HIT) family protein
MKDCIFCKIVNGEIPATKIYEDDSVIAFLDISQVSLGHTLVIPKSHYDSFLSTPKAEMNHVMNVAQSIGQVAMEVFKAQGVNVLMNCGSKAGQSVMHYHVHIIPRYGKKDGFLLEFTPNALKGDLLKVANQFPKIIITD